MIFFLVFDFLSLEYKLVLVSPAISYGTYTFSLPYNI